MKLNFKTTTKKVCKYSLLLLAFLSANTTYGQGACVHTVNANDPKFAHTAIPKNLLQPVSTTSIGITTLTTDPKSWNQRYFTAYNSSVASYIRVVGQANGSRAMVEVFLENGDSFEVPIRARQTIDFYVQKVVLKTDFRDGVDNPIHFPEISQYGSVVCPGQPAYQEKVGSYRLNIYCIIENTLNNLKIRWADYSTIPTSPYEDYGSVLRPEKYPKSRLIFAGDEAKTIEVAEFPAGLKTESVYIETADDYNKAKNHKSIKMGVGSTYVRGKFVWVTYKGGGTDISPGPTYPKPNTNFRYRTVNE